MWAGLVSVAVNRGRGVINRNGPIVAGHVPVELVMIGEEARAVTNRVDDLDGARGVDRAGDVNLQIAIIS